MRTSKINIITKLSIHRIIRVYLCFKTQHLFEKQQYQRFYGYCKSAEKKKKHTQILGSKSLIIFIRMYSHKKKCDISKNGQTYKPIHKINIHTNTLTRISNNNLKMLLLLFSFFLFRMLSFLTFDRSFRIKPT